MRIIIIMRIILFAQFYFFFGIVLLSASNNDIEVQSLYHQQGDEIIKSFQEYMESIQTLDFKTLSFDSPQKRENDVVFSHSLYDFKNKRLKITFYNVEEKSINEASIKDYKPKYLTERLICKNIVNIPNTFLDLIYKKEIDSNKKIDTRDIDNFEDFPYTLNARMRKDNEWCNELESSFLGYIFFNQTNNTSVSFWEVASKMNIVTARAERWKDKIQVFFIEMKAENQVAKFWLDPTKQFAPVCIQYEQSAIFSVKERFFATMKYEFENYEQISDIWFPKTILIAGKTFPIALQSPDGKRTLTIPAQSFNRYLEMVDIKINPKLSDHDFTFSMSVPDGTRVLIDDRSISHLKYVWQTNRVVLWTDELALAQARGHGFIPGVREPRFWLMAAGLIMIVCALTIKIRRYYLENGKGGK